MHEEVFAHAHTQDKDQHQISKEICLVLFPQEVSGDGRKDKKAQAVSESQGTEKSGSVCLSYWSIQFAGELSAEHAHGAGNLVHAQEIGQEFGGNRLSLSRLDWL